MRYVKMFGLAALAATALMALVGVGTASATKGVACSTATNPCTSRWAVPTAFDLSLTPGGSSQFRSTSGTTLTTCTTATFQGILTKVGSSTETATGENTAFTWGTVATPCSPYAETTTTLGKFKIEVDGDGNGEFYSDAEMEFTLHVPGFLGGPCVYKIPPDRTIGTWDESLQELTINAIVDRTQTGTHPCVFGSETNVWNATFVKTSPTTTLYISTS